MNTVRRQLDLTNDIFVCRRCGRRKKFSGDRPAQCGDCNEVDRDLHFLELVAQGMAVNDAAVLARISPRMAELLAADT